MIRIIYHNDNDGKCSAFIARHFLEFKAEAVVCEKADYDTKVLETIPIAESDTVYILDYSISPDDMRKLLDITPNVVWIDHHKTSLAEYENFDLPVSGIRDTKSKKSGALLTWEWFSQRRAPQFVLLVSDWDTYTFEYGTDTELFHYGIISIGNDPMDNGWDLAWENLQHVLDMGSPAMNYAVNTSVECVTDTGFWIEWEDCICYAVNGRQDSKIMAQVAPSAEMWVTFRYTGECWMVGLASDQDGVNVREIAEKYKYNGRSGGGHDHAAGFECETLPFDLSRKVQESRQTSPTPATAG